MKRFFGIALTLVLLAAPAFAGKKAPTVSLPWAVQAGSATVPAGDYHLAIAGSGSDVQVTLTQDGKTVATFSAKAVAGKYNRGFETNTLGGVVVLDSIYLNDVKLVLESAKQTGQ
ncbi:MAG: hypothetical protein ABR990_01240 [Terracidiphilus sp.]|jgi:hypothetical protein